MRPRRLRSSWNRAAIMCHVGTHEPRRSLVAPVRGTLPGATVTVPVAALTVPLRVGW